MPPRKSKNSLRNPISSPLRSPKTLKKTKAVGKAKSLQQELIKANDSDLVATKIVVAAVQQLIEHNKRQEADEKKNDLLEDERHIDEDLELVFQFKKYLTLDAKLKPKLVKLSHSVYNLSDEFKICLIVRDSIVKTEAELEQIEEANIPYLSKILPFKELYNEYKTYDQKRQLASSYDLFLADDGVVTNLPSILGKTFYRSKVPIPIKVGSTGSSKSFAIDTIKNKVEQAVKSTHFLIRPSSNLSIKIGNIANLSEKENISNVQTALKQIEEKYAQFGIRAVYIKLKTSPALPLFYDNKLALEDSQTASVDDTKTVVSDNEYVIGDQQIIAKGVKLSAFEQGLLEIGQFDEEPQFLEKKKKLAAKESSKKPTKTTQKRSKNAQSINKRIKV